MHEAVFDASPERTAVTVAPGSALEHSLAVVAPDGHVAFASVLAFDRDDDFPSADGLSERVQRALGELTGRAVRVFESAGPAASAMVQSESRYGAVTLVADPAWLTAMAPAPPIRGSAAVLEFVLPGRSGPEGGVFVPGGATAAFVELDGERIGCELGVAKDGLVVRPVAEAPLDGAVDLSGVVRCRFRGTTARVARGAWWLEVGFEGVVVCDAGWTGRATWVTDGVRVAVRVSDVAHGRESDPLPETDTMTATVEVSLADAVSATTVKPVVDRSPEHGAPEGGRDDR